MFLRKKKSILYICSKIFSPSMAQHYADGHDLNKLKKMQFEKISKQVSAFLAIFFLRGRLYHLVFNNS